MGRLLGEGAGQKFRFEMNLGKSVGVGFWMVVWASDEPGKGYEWPFGLVNILCELVHPSLTNVQSPPLADHEFICVASFNFPLHTLRGSGFIRLVCVSCLCWGWDGWLCVCWRWWGLGVNERWGQTSGSESHSCSELWKNLDSDPDPKSADPYGHSAK